MNIYQMVNTHLPLQINGTHSLPLKISGETYLRFPSEVSALLNLLFFHAPNPKWSPAQCLNELYFPLLTAFQIPASYLKQL